MSPTTNYVSLQFTSFIILFFSASLFDQTKASRQEDLPGGIALCNDFCFPQRFAEELLRKRIHRHCQLRSFPLSFYYHVRLDALFKKYYIINRHPGHDAYSQAALKITDKGWNDNNLYNAEVSAGSPDMEQLRFGIAFITNHFQLFRSRAVQLAVALCKRYLPIVMANTDKLNPVCKGCLVFLPGASDTIMASLEFNRAIESLSNSNFIKVYVYVIFKSFASTYF